MSIIFENISKKFRNSYVLQGISLKIDTNQVYCLLGRNGVGKSTLINLACNLLDPDEGNIFINGKTYETNAIAIKQSIGLQSQYDTLIAELNTFDYLQFVGRIYRMKQSNISAQIKLLTEYFFDDISELKKTINTYSTGMKRKVSLCAAFLHKPFFIFLDEPFSNIDPISANALCKLIQGYKNENRCIIISSHDMLYVNKIATHIGVIDNQKLVYDGTLDGFRSGEGLDLDMLKYVHASAKDDILLDQIIK